MGSLTLGDRAARSAWRLVPTRALSDAIGWGSRQPIPSVLREPVLRAFARRYRIEIDEAEKPLAAYSSLDEFFTRRLRADARPLDPSSRSVLSSADGTVVERGVARAGRLFRVKDTALALSDLIGDLEAARRLEGGDYLITYLSPKDYHRVHAPIAGRVVSWQHVPGTLFCVNAKSVAREPGLFGMNERFITLLDGEAGLCAVVMVAAVGVGHVTASFDPDVETHGFGFMSGMARRKGFAQPPVLERGGELGVFHLGSTTVVVFEAGRVALDPIEAGSRTRMGERIGKLVGPSC